MFLSKYLSLLFLFVILNLTVFGQVLPFTKQLNGKVKSVSEVRTYIIENGQHVYGNPLTLSVDTYDLGGELAQRSVFGNGEERTTYDRTGSEVKVRVAYYELSGAIRPVNAAPFLASTDEVKQNGLCSEFTTVTDTRSMPKSETITETCKAGSMRSITQQSYDENDKLIRIKREDSLGRSWETVLYYRSDGEVIKWKYEVGQSKVVNYSHEIQYADIRLDGKKNRVRAIASAFNSLRGYELVYQYVEEQKITYHD